jgi:hypothetical protein
MFGCLRRLGCLVVLLVLGVLAWFNRDRLEAIYRRYAGGPPSVDSASAIRLAGWEPLTPEKAARGKSSVEALSRSGGPAYTNLTAGEAASYIFLEAAKQLPASSQDITASVTEDRLNVRASVALKDLDVSKALGPLAGFLGERDTIQLGGSIHVLRPGVGEFQVKDVKVGALSVPSAIIPRLIKNMRRGEMPEGISPSGLPMKLPPYIADVRIGDGRITVYKLTK